MIKTVTPFLCFKEFERQYDGDEKMVVTEHSSGNLSRLCQYVCHIVLSAWETGGSSEQVNRADPISRYILLYVSETVIS